MRTRLVASPQELSKLLGLKAESWLPVPEPILKAPGPQPLAYTPLDSAVLSAIAASSPGDGLEIGTGCGQGTCNLAKYLPQGKVYTVNPLPEQVKTPDHPPLSISDIGALLRKEGVTNYEQIYANPIDWDIPRFLSELSFVLISGEDSAADVRASSLKLWERIRPGGFLIWHGFSPANRSSDKWVDSVMQGVEAFGAELQLDAEVFFLPNSRLGILQKPARESGIKVLDRSASAKDPVPELKRIRAVHAYAAYNDACPKREEAYVQRMRALGYDLTGFPLECPGGWWPFPKLDDEWRKGTRSLMEMYARLEILMRDQDVLIADGGSMLHPLFLRRISAFKILFCADDPESSEILSRPIATYFDCACPANIACLDDYRAWGCKRVEWIFHGINPADSLPFVNEANFHSLKRDIDIIMLCERIYGVSNRAQRIEALMQEFPQAFVRGSGWPEGRVPEQEPYYARSRIGWNLHNSIGPTNSRVISLPALGVMQICDNKSNLGKILELDKEVVGFDDIKECIDKTRYYLAHESERAEIAWNSWQRVMRDYTEEAKLRKMLALSLR